MRTLLATVLAGMLAGQSGFSWGNDGHEIVARIAAKHLTKKTRAAVADLLRNDTKVTLPANPTDAQVEDAMATVATWPDHINKTATGTEEWHFIDIGLLEGKEAIAKRCGLPESCVVDKITEIQTNLKSGAKLGNFEPFEELKFLIHFVGDVHQPLHASTNQDAGGNCVKTKGFSASELHAVWDTGLVEKIKKGAAGQATSTNGDVAQALDTAIVSTDSAAWVKTTEPGAIAMESHQAAIDNVYAPLRPVVKQMPGFVPGIRPGSCVGAPPVLKKKKWNVTPVYQEPTLTVVRTQLSKAGIRLAQILNDMFDPTGTAD